MPKNPNAKNANGKNANGRNANAKNANASAARQLSRFSNMFIGIIFKFFWLAIFYCFTAFASDFLKLDCRWVSANANGKKWVGDDVVETMTKMASNLPKCKK